MKLPERAVKYPTITWVFLALLLLSGLLSFFQLGRLEDPEFTVKSATVITAYPGASAVEVEKEVTDRLELAIQRLPEIDFLESLSRPGLSIIKVNLSESVRSERLPQIWDNLRKYVRDATPKLPPGVSEPMVGDDFGDVFGFLFAVIGDGFTPAELERYADDIRNELSLVRGVASVKLWGVQERCIYVQTSPAQMAGLGLTTSDVRQTLQQQNMVVPAGAMDVQGQRIRFVPTGEFRSPEDIGDLLIAGQPSTARGATGLLRVRDVATVRRGYVDPPTEILRWNGHPAIAVAVSNISGYNVVQLGLDLEHRLNEMKADLPIGIEIERISWQSDLIRGAINSFTRNLIMAVLIVVVVIWIAMGWRMAVVVGTSGLLFSIIGSFTAMHLWEIDLQRVSLGALVVAMGMMVDNAIVVADGMLVRIRRGMDRVQAAIQAASQPAWPLFGATVIAVLAFFPIYAARSNVGEYCQSLFQVVAISLMLSWALSITVAPLMCIGLLGRTDASAGDQGEPRSMRWIRAGLMLAIRRRAAAVAGLVLLLAVTVVAFGWVDRSFFGEAERTQFMLDYWMREGTGIQQTDRDVRELEQRLLAIEGIRDVSSFIGRGPPRFYLPVAPEMPYASYAQLIVNTRSVREARRVAEKLREQAPNWMPDGRIIVRPFMSGPNKPWPFEARITGPADADIPTLRRLASRIRSIVDESPDTLASHVNWREPSRTFVIEYDQARGRWTGISRSDVGSATLRGHDGVRVGVYREDEHLLPIIFRHDDAYRRELADDVGLLQVRSRLGTESTPIMQVARDLRLDWEDPIIWRRDRHRTISVLAVPSTMASSLMDSVQASIQAIDLPPGYELDFGGEYEDSAKSQASLIPGIIPAFALIFITVVLLFNGLRQPLIIGLVVPLALVGVTLGLLITGLPLSFMALLGTMSLVGMMIKNAIVLLDEAALELEKCRDHLRAIVNATVSRARPVALAAGTTVLGVIPLLQDSFWSAMAVTIMFGLALGSILMLVFVPIAYTLLYQVPLPATVSPRMRSAIDNAADNDSADREETGK
ncbi:MAG: efflux RND transporter permease subunit [Phycisphaeraceae bacterium]|nr:efflux RND transporter permease subunit [Phycisphaeraceae bacterium]